MVAVLFPPFFIFDNRLQHFHKEYEDRLRSIDEYEYVNLSTYALKPLLQSIKDMKEIFERLCVLCFQAETEYEDYKNVWPK